MAQIPTPRSYPTILGDMINTFLSRFGIKNLKVGNPVLSILEAAAQSDLRSSQDVFNMLNSVSLDRATGSALDRIGLDEDVPRYTDTIATGLVTFSDTSFTKKATKVYQGLAAPIIGTTVINVADASLFPASGSLYIGRNTTNFEGPIAYTSTSNLGSYWTITLSSGTTKFHNLNETVILAQGGTRTIQSGTVVQTLQGNVSDAVQFSTVYAASIPDGETSVDGVLVAAKKSGIIGNVAANTITSFPSTTPYTGAAVNNSLPYSNATATESDGDYRNRIKQARQTRARGTALAIQTSVIGVVAQDENKRITSSSIVSRQAAPVTLYIDDGTGYEESTVGIAIENVVDSALGGEQYFQLASTRKSITKAFVKTTLVAPFALVNGSTLNIKVNGVLSVHVFKTADFKAINSASAYEVAASINANPLIGFNARTAEGGTKVVVFAIADTNESIEVVAPISGTDANLFLGFPAGKVDTLKLYKNDRLLNKDGSLATINSNIQSGWSAMASGETLTISVDGTAAQTYTFSDSDFVAAGTGFSTLASTNSLASWASVFNKKIPGITATAGINFFSLASNAGLSSRASVVISGGTLLSKGMFNASVGLSSTGTNQDYTLNRNTAQGKLLVALSTADKLSAGTLNTRAFVQSASIPSINIVPALGARFWFVIDGAAQVISSNVNSGISITASNTTTTRWRYTSNVVNSFVNVQVNDWVIHWDPSFDTTNVGFWRVANIDPTANHQWYEIDRTSTPSVVPISLSASGIVFVRSTGIVQQVTIPQGNAYTPSTLVAQISLRGAAASVYLTNYIRISTNTFGSNGDVSLVAQDVAASGLGFIINTTPVTNGASHVAVVESGNVHGSQPTFIVIPVTSSVAPYNNNMSAGIIDTNLTSNSFVTFLRGKVDGTFSSRSGNNMNSGSTVASYIRGGPTVNFRVAFPSEISSNDRFYISYNPFSIAPDDNLIVVVDGDTSSKSFTIPLYRRVKPSSSSYGTTQTFVDLDNNNQALAQIFGTTFNFQDFNVYLKPRAKTSQSGGVDTTSTILWRYFKFAPANYGDATQGNGSTTSSPAIRYIYPNTPSTPVGITLDNTTNIYPLVNVSLPTGAARSSVPAFAAASQLGLVISGGSGNTLYTYSYICNFLVSSATRTTNVTALTLTLPLSITDHQLQIGDVIWLQSTDINFTSGAKTITARSATTISYSDVAANAGPIANIGTVSKNPTGELTFTGTTVVVGDIARLGTVLTFSVGDGSNFGSAYMNKTMRVSALSNQFFSATSDSNLGNDSNAANNGLTIIWRPVGDPTGITFYPIDSGNNQAGQIAAAVNSLAAGNPSGIPVTAVAVGNGVSSTGVIAQASTDTQANRTYVDIFSDGQNSVSTAVFGGNYTFTFKDAVSTILQGTNSDWINEEVRLVPCNVTGIVNYLNAALSGLFQASSIVASSRAGKVQISSATAGSTSSVQVSGGTASSSAASVVAGVTYGPVAGATAGKYGTIQIPALAGQGFYGGEWVALNNSVAMTKNVFDATSNLANILATGWLKFDPSAGAKKPWSFSVGSTVQLNLQFQVEKQGNFVCYAYTIGTAPVITGAQEGDWVFFGAAPAWTVNTAYTLNCYVTNAGNMYQCAGTGTSALSGNGPVHGAGTVADNTTSWTYVSAAPTISSANRGYFRVVRTDFNHGAVWVENPNAVEETITTDMGFLNYDSVIPGDQITFNPGGALGTLFGTNLGTFSVTQIDLYGTYVSPLFVSFQLNGTLNAVAPGVLGAPYVSLVCREGTPGRMIKQIANIGINPSNSSYLDVKLAYSTNWNSVLSNGAGSRNFSSIAGTTMQALGKLNFPTPISSGVDGYTYSSGLIGEANRVIYGDRQDPAGYPGYVAAGANVNISGPIIRRITVSLLIRARAGVSLQDISDRVKSAVASVINKTGVGVSIALSDVIAAATQINGVVSVTILSPTYNSANDLISIQPAEKPLVISLDSDISVTFTN